MKNILKISMKTLIGFILCFAIGCGNSADEDNDIGGGNDGSEIPIEDLHVGQACQGGIIAYIDETGKHGLIAAPKDQSAGIPWGGNFVTGARGTAIGTGKSNTEKIIQMQGTWSCAAKLCDDLVLNGYDDWFLPSKDELNVLCRNRATIGGFSYGSIYWSSSEYNVNVAYSQDFGNGVQYYNNKGSKTIKWRVRAVRAF